MQKRLKLVTLVFVFLLTSLLYFEASAQQPQKPPDPKAWGSNHAGKPVPEFVHGDECLFCHRNDIGPGWSKNTHALTVRHREDAAELQGILKQPSLAATADQVEYFMGSRHRVRFLKKNGYGKFDLLNAQAEPGSGGQAARLIDYEKPSWDKEKFANRCAGCHATAVDASTKAFSEFGIDCYTCHGVVDLKHTGDISLIFLSKKRRSDARAITSTC